MTNPKPATIVDLEAELAQLQARHLDIDIAALTHERDKAQAAHDSYQPYLGKGWATPEESRLLSRLGDAKNALSNAALRAADLERLMRPLQAMVGGPARAVEAQSLVDAAAEAERAAGAGVAAARETADRLSALLVDAEAEHTAASAAAAQEMLAATKAGRAPPTGRVNRVNLDTLTDALSMARAELIEAQAAHSTTTAALQSATDQLHAAQRDEARLALELGMRDFAHVVAKYREKLGDQRSYLARDFPSDELRRCVSLIESTRAAGTR